MGIAIALLSQSAMAQENDEMYCPQFMSCDSCTANVGCGWQNDLGAGFCLAGNSAGPFQPLCHIGRSAVPLGQ
jgi:hypothetical protein